MTLLVLGKKLVGLLRGNNWRGVLLAVCSAVFIFSAYKIVDRFLDDRENADMYADIRALYYEETETAAPAVQDSPVKTTAPTVSTVLSPSPSPSPAPKRQEPERVKKESFAKLAEINRDITGWIRIPYTDTDYPVVKGKDNVYYLTHTVTGKKLKHGAIFMDYRNHTAKLDFNTILYGHNMSDGSMFGAVPMFKNKAFFEKCRFITFETPAAKGKWEVFSVYVTDTGFDYLRTGFSSKEETEAFITLLKEKSLFRRDIAITPEDRLLTLSTCSYEFKDARTVVHARLVK